MFRKSSKGDANVSGLASLSPTTSIPRSMTNADLPFPKLIVFDLDYTLWPFWVDTHVTPPLKSNQNHSAATDRYGEDFSFYVDVPHILQTLPHVGIKLGVASRTSSPGIAKDMLKMLHIPAVPEVEDSKARKASEAFAAGTEMYPGSKVNHFEVLQKRTGIAYEDMLFFDDESRNRDTESLGVTMWLVRDGLNWDEVEKGVGEWRKRKGFPSSEVKK